jgi:hypothetical protein
MKKTMNTRILAIALASIFAVTFSTTVLANDEKKAIPVELKFIGNIENQPVFQLTFSSPDENEFTIVVRDEFNTVLYRDNVKAGNITKKFLLNTEELGNTAIQFEITGKKTHKKVIYEVNKQERFVEDVVINKMN